MTVAQIGMGSPLVKISNMPFLKNIGLKSKKGGAAAAPEMSVSIIATATGSAGYYTSSIIGGINRIYTGACDFDPHYINITFSTSSVVGGTAPYVTKWTSSMSYYPPGYTIGTETGSFTGKYYAYESDIWTVTVTDSSTPAKIASASIHSVIYSLGFEIIVGKLDGNVATGSDTQLFDPLILPGGPDAPLATIGAGIRYSVPDNTYIYVASGTYAENPVIDKKILQIQSADGTNSASLAQGNYFIYATKEFGDVGLRSTGVFSNSYAFTTSSFNIIGVTPSGSIQNAMFDVEPSGTVKVLAGIHEISTPISYSLNKAIYIDGITIPTGSSDTYFYQPSSILRMVNQNINMFDSGTSIADNTGGFHKISNLALEIYTGSFFFFPSGVTRNIYLESVKFRLISASVAYDMNTLNHQPTVTSYMNAGGETTRPDERNIRSARYIKDGLSNQSFGWGSGRVLFGPYAPIGVNNFLNSSLISFSQHFEANAHQFSNPVSQSRTTDIYNAMHNGFDVSAERISNISLISRRPTYAKNTPSFNGLSYLSFDGVDEFLGTSVGSFPANHITASCIGYCVFAPNVTPTGTNKAVVWKFGDYKTGFSLVLTGSRAAFNFYATSSNVTSSVMMLGNITTDQPYLLEFFFDGNSTNKRVGMALYGTGSMITSSYFSSTQFSSNKFYYVYIPDLGNTSIGCANGEYRHDNDLTILNDGRIDFYNGRWAASIFIPNDTGSQIKTNSNKRQTEIYNYLRYKFFPTSSIVTRSISCDNQ